MKTPNNIAKTRVQHIENLAAFLWCRFLYYVIAASGPILSDAVTYVNDTHRACDPYLWNVTSEINMVYHG